MVTLGDASYGRDSAAVSGFSDPSGGVVNIFSTNEAFAALKEEGSVVAWGNADLGGNISNVSTQLSNGVKNVFSTDVSFLALKENEKLVAWEELKFTPSMVFGDDDNDGYDDFFDPQKIQPSTDL